AYFRSARAPSRNGPRTCRRSPARSSRTLPQQDGTTVAQSFKLMHLGSVSARSKLGLRRLEKASIRSLEDLGPGLITGAADDDPSGIATYSQAGAQFGYGLMWTMVLCYPL